MSFSGSPQVLPPSNHSLFTPSYSASVLVPIKCEELELELEPSLPKAPRKSSPLPASLFTPSSEKSSLKTRDPIQYQKLKMNYLRRLNVIPIISQKDVLNVLGKESCTKDLSGGKKHRVKASRKTESTKKGESEAYAKTRFVPSFLPSNGVPSKPIPIPTRAKKLSSFPEELEKGDIHAGSLHFKPASVMPEHFGVFFPDFEL